MPMLFFAKAINLTATARLAVSMNAGLRNYVANYNSVDPTDYVFRNDVRQTTPNVGFGVMFYNNAYFLGVSVPEINIRTLGNASVQNSSDFRNHYYLTGGFESETSEDFRFRYVGLLSYSKDIPVIADISTTMIIKETLGLGVNYRTDKELAGIMSVNVDRFRIGYSYQFGTSPSNIGGYSNATHEVTLGYRFLKAKTQQ